MLCHVSEQMGWVLVGSLFFYYEKKCLIILQRQFSFLHSEVPFSLKLDIQLQKNEEAPKEGGKSIVMIQWYEWSREKWMALRLQHYNTGG